MNCAPLSRTNDLRSINTTKLSRRQSLFDQVFVGQVQQPKKETGATENKKKENFHTRALGEMGNAHSILTHIFTARIVRIILE